MASFYWILEGPLRDKRSLCREKSGSFPQNEEPVGRIELGDGSTKIGNSILLVLERLS